MRLLMLLYNTTGKGTYWRALHLAQRMARRGHAVTVLSTSPRAGLRVCTRSDTEPGVTLVEVPGLLPKALRSGWDPWSTIARILWMRGKAFDIVHAFESRPTVIFPALYAKRRLRSRLVLDWCDWFGRGGSVAERPSALVRALLGPVETFFEEHYRTRADGTTVINTALHSRAIALGVTEATILHLPNGSDTEHLHPMPKDEARQAVGWSSDSLIIGHIGAVFLRDAILMATAFDQLRQSEPRAHLLLAGYCNYPIENLVDEPAAVHRTGQLTHEQINFFLAACDVCWLPLSDTLANRGRYPLKITDYMAVGKPVIATRVGDVPEVIERWGIGVVVADTPAELASQTAALLRDPAQMERMGRRARECAETEFNWDSIAEKVDGFYQRILK